MKLTRIQIDKLQELETFHLNESIRKREEYDKVFDSRFQVYGDGKLVNDVEGLMNALSKFEHPFFSMAICTRMIEQRTVITDDGICTMTWRLEWDHNMINGAFKNGCEWANTHGAGIPIGEDNDDAA